MMIQRSELVKKYLIYHLFIIFIGFVMQFGAFFFGAKSRVFMVSNDLKYGFEALENVKDEFLLATLVYFPFVPIYQFIYFFYEEYKNNKEKKTKNSNN